MITTRRKFSNGSLHSFLIQQFGSEPECQDCGRKCITQHALKHGKEYSINIDDYLNLCSKCHKQYDYHLENSRSCNCNVEQGTFYNHGWNYAKLLVPANDNLCEYCNKTMEHKRRTAKFCSDRCSTNAYRVRQGQETIKNLFDICQNPLCKIKLPENRHWRMKYCTTSCKKKVFNTKDSTKQKRHINYMENKPVSESEINNLIEGMMSK